MTLVKCLFTATNRSFPSPPPARRVSLQTPVKAYNHSRICRRCSSPQSLLQVLIMKSEGCTYRLRGERRPHASAPDREESRVSVRVTHWLGGLPAPPPPPRATTPPRKQARGPITDDNKRERVMPACVWCRLYGVRSSSVEAPLSQAPWLCWAEYGC